MKADGRIRRVFDNRRKYLPLLLLGDEQESMVEKYLDRGDLFALEERGTVRAVCIVTQEGPGLYELQNIAVAPEYQRQGIGRAMVDFIWGYYSDMKILQLGTGDSLSTVRFYQTLGFQEFDREKGYFLHYYDHPIYEDGKQLKDRICFRKTKAP